MGNSNQQASEKKMNPLAYTKIKTYYPLDILVYGNIFSLFNRSSYLYNANVKEYSIHSLKWIFTRVENHNDILSYLNPTEVETSINNDVFNCSCQSKKQKKQNIVLLYQVNTIFSEEVLLLIQSLEAISVIYHPFIIFITNQANETIKQFREYYQSNFIDLDIRNIYIANLINDNNIKEIYFLLFKISSYYHQLGDVIQLPYSFNANQYLNRSTFTTDNKLILIKDHFPYRINLLIIGRPGAGKSTFINAILGEKRSKQMAGKSVTSDVIAYKHPLYPITLIDTPGMESNECMEKQFDLFDNLDNKPLFVAQREIIHMVIYVNSCSDERTFYNTEIDFIKKFKGWSKDYYLNNINNKKEIPLIFAMTHGLNHKRSKLKKSIMKLELKKILLDDYRKNSIFRLELVDDEEFPSFGMGKLFNYIYNYFKDEVVDEITISQINVMPLERESRIYSMLSQYTLLSRLKLIEDVLSYYKEKAKGVIEIFMISIENMCQLSKPFANVKFVNDILELLSILIGDIYKVQLTKDEMLFMFFTEIFNCTSNGHSLKNMTLLEGTQHIGDIIIQMYQVKLRAKGVRNLILDEINQYNYSVDSLKDHIGRFNY